MKIVVIGGTGLIGSKLVKNLEARGHEVVAASPASGVNAVTGEGLEGALAGAQVVVDVANSPSFADADVLAFFERSSKNLAAAELAAGVKHHVALSVVGADRLPDSGYLRAKVAQERIIAASKVPYSVLRATQFFEFVGRIVDGATQGTSARLSTALLQPMSGDDVAAALTEVALAAPLNGISEVAGPDSIRLDELGRQYLSAKRDAREVVGDASAPYFGAVLNDAALRPGAGPRLGATRFADWLRTNAL